MPFDPGILGIGVEIYGSANDLGHVLKVFANNLIQSLLADFLAKNIVGPEAAASENMTQGNSEFAGGP